MPASKPRPHVLILGAGIGGLTLAQTLRKQGITFEVFERDANIHARFQGWAIALSSMLPDLRQSLPEDVPPVEVTNHLLPLNNTPEFVMYQGDYTTRVTSSESRPFVRSNRARLRDWLSTNIDIKFNKHVTNIEELSDSVTIHFEDGTSATGDVLVGADGVHSFVRHYLCEGKDKLRNIPSAQVVGEVKLPREKFERQMKIGTSAYVYMATQQKRLFCGLNSVDPDGEHANYYWMYVWLDDTVIKNGERNHWTMHASKEESYEFALRGSEEFEPRFREIIQLTKPEGMMTPPVIIRDMEPVPLPNRRITLIGDAAHPMTPYRGEGGDHAIRDAVYLGRILGRCQPDNLLEHLKSYQDEMFVRGTEAVRNSRGAVSDDGTLTRRGWNDRYGKYSQAIEAK